MGRAIPGGRTVPGDWKKSTLSVAREPLAVRPCLVTQYPATGNLKVNGGQTARDGL